MKTGSEPGRNLQSAFPLFLKKYSYSLLIVAGAALCLLFLKIYIMEAVAVPTSSMEETMLPGDFFVCNKIGLQQDPSVSIPFTNIVISLPHLFPPDSLVRFQVVTFAGEKPYGSFTSSDEVFVKRIIGLPGETIQLIDAQVFINNFSIDEPKLLKKTERMLYKGEEGIGIHPAGFGWNENFYGPLLIPQKGKTVRINDSTAALYADVIQSETPEIQHTAEGFVYQGKILASYTFRENYYFVMGDSRNNSKDSRYNGFVSRRSIRSTPVFIYLSFNPDAVSFSDYIRFSRIGKGVQ